MTVSGAKSEIMKMIDEYDDSKITRASLAQGIEETLKTLDKSSFEAGTAFAEDPGDDYADEYEFEIIDDDEIDDEFDDYEPPVNEDDVEERGR